MITNIKANEKYIKAIYVYALESDLYSNDLLPAKQLYYDEDGTEPVYVSDLELIMAYGWVYDSDLYPVIGFVRLTSYGGPTDDGTVQATVKFQNTTYGYDFAADPEDYVHPLKRGITWERSTDVFTKNIPMYSSMSGTVLYHDPGLTKPVYNSEYLDAATYGTIQLTYSGTTLLGKVIAFKPHTPTTDALIVARICMSGMMMDGMCYLTTDPDAPEPTIDDFTYSFIRMGNAPEEEFGPNDDTVWFLNRYQDGQSREATGEEIMRACNLVTFHAGSAAVFDENHNLLFRITSGDQMGSEGNKSGVICFMDEDGVLYVPAAPDLWAKTYQGSYTLRYGPFGPDDPDLEWAGGYIGPRACLFIWDVYDHHDVSTSVPGGCLYFEDGRDSQKLSATRFHNDTGSNKIYIECEDGTKAWTTVYN